MTGDPLWYKDAVIYEAHVRAFQDSNGDGIGDFKGLTSRLDYIQDLGVNTIWLLPFYPSPGKDDGYDISDYHEIHPSYGTREDFKAFIDEAHRRNLRVITELVINHTSDQHPWFQAARQAEAGSPKREFYVWSDTPNKYSGTRIIFTDTETSNWTWDPVAKAYYWHRFFSHQPDLNFDNPEVEKAVIKTMRYWLDQGVDGLRLDAIPYLIERDGTSNENLRETHDVVKRIRKVIDEHYSDRMLLGEANMWPEDVRDYFADGDECHVAYHFPLMPRMYMAIAQEDRYPIAEIIDQTPDIPPNCQWAIFLRNHDELTLEMVTSRERDYMYQMYAAEPRARLNLGIRRRLAPLMENDIERIKLMNSLLLSMPGSPIIYYGDEIGMGDNFYLGDRNGVRTPMQWSPDRNAGFSRADPERLYLPPIMDPVYGFQAVNVEAQARDRSSLLNWMKRLLEVRKSSQAFGRGTMRFIRPGNRKVLCYVREHGDDTILCVVNLARSAQPVELNLSEFKGLVPVELLGRTPFPAIGELPYQLTLQGHGFFWFRLSRTDASPSWSDDRQQREDAPVLVLIDGWHSLFPDRVATWRESLAVKLRGQFETRVLPPYLATQRWYGDKGARPTRAALADGIEWAANGLKAMLGLFDVESSQTTVRYFVPLVLAFEDGDEAQWTKLQASAIARVRQQATLGVISDALTDERFVRSVVAAIGAGTEIPSKNGALRFLKTKTYDELMTPETEAPIQAPHAQGSNTALKIGERLFLKVYRRLQAGVNPEFEIGRYLTEVAHFPNAVPVAGALEYTTNDGIVYTLALLQGFVANQGDGWDYTVNHLVRFLEDRKVGVPMPADAHAVYLAMIRTLGVRTAQLHLALAARSADGAFGSEPLTADDMTAMRARLLEEAKLTFDQLADPARVPDSARKNAAQLVGARDAISSQLEKLTATLPQTLKCRVHGDFHLGQVLVQKNDFVLVDFEGEPARTQDERRRKQSPLRDVAGLLRSLAYARHAAQLRCALDGADDCAKWTALLLDWERQARVEFVAGYDETARGQIYEDLKSVAPLIDAFELEKALYEVRYELGNRPEWAVIPISALIHANE